MKVLLIEDDAEIVESISLALQICWPETLLISTHLGKTGIKLARGEELDLIILDLGLPDISGFKVLKRIRLFSSVSIVILTVKAEEDNIVKGLDLGADDYIVKPCGQSELIARVRARMRNKSLFFKSRLPISFGTLSFNPSTRKLMRGGKEIKVTITEAHIIHHLMRRKRRVSTYSSLAEEVWGSDYPWSLESLRVHIRRLREKLEANPDKPRIILSKYGEGYHMAKPG